MLQTADSKRWPAPINISAASVKNRQRTGSQKQFGIAAHCITKTFSFRILLCPANKKKEVYGKWRQQPDKGEIKK